MKLRRKNVLNLLVLSSLCLIAWHCGFFKGLGSLLAPEPTKPTSSTSNSNLKLPQTLRREKTFVFREDFSFPQPLVMRELAEIEPAPWIHSLRTFLHSLDPSMSHIYLLTSNFDYVDVLLNWLISAVVRSDIPIKTILTVSMDYATHRLLIERGFNSIFVSPSFLFLPSAEFSQPFEKVMMLRLAIMRIINHFGFNVAMFDTDAILLRDPQPLFAGQVNADIVGSVGTIPDDLFAEWKVTICIGVVLVRSTPKTEQYWNAMKDIHEECVDDQGKLNYGLKALGIQWHSNSNHQNITVHGRASNGLQVSILPYDDICRLEACVVERRNRYYVWHKGGQRTRRKKLHSAREGKTWFLRYKWDKIESKLVGKEWLKSIAYMGVTME